MLDHGHSNAGDYPIAMVWDEATLVVERKNSELATIGVLIQSATLTTGMGSSKEAVGHFKDLIKTLNGE